MTDLELAIKALPGHSIALCKDGQILTNDKRGIAPMADWIAEKKDLAGYCAADLIVGKAAAMLFLKAGIRSVYADTLSESGKNFLEDHGIPVRFRHLTPMIENRSKTDICPMERTVLDVADAETGCRLLLEKLAALRAGKP